jgi:hypothetical protein
MSAYDGEVSATESVYLADLTDTGAMTAPTKRFTLVPADAYGGELRWTGDRFGIAWSDRRDARGATLNYEVYFNLINPDGTKRLPDVRLTHADGFSINSSLAWTGSEFVVVWQDDGMNAAGRNEIFGQRISLAGAPVGGNIRLVDDQGTGQESPRIAVGPRSLGIVWMRGDATTHQLMFAPFDRQLRPLAPPAVLTPRMAKGVFPAIVYNQSRYIIVWYDPDSAPKTIYGTVLDELGKQLVAAAPIVQTPGHGRYPAILPFGDRALLVWSDDRDGNYGYELYTKMIDSGLKSVTRDMRLTQAIGDSIDPIAASGTDDGVVGVLFADNRSGSQQVYFLSLNCVPEVMP